MSLAQNLAFAPHHDPLDSVETLVTLAAQTVPPLWPLESPIAVNPLSGFEDLPFADALGRAAGLFGASMTQGLRHWRALMAAGRVDRAGLSQVAVQRLGGPDAAFREVAPGVSALTLLMARLTDIDEGEPQSAARVLDRGEAFVAKWCAAFFDRGLASVPMPGREQGLYRAVLALCRHDGEFRALAGLRAAAVLKAMPEDPFAAIREVLFDLGEDEAVHLEWARTMLARLPGWAGHLRWRSEKAPPELSDGAPAIMADLLALWALVHRAENRKGARRRKPLPHDPRPAVQRHFGLPDRTFEHMGGARKAQADHILRMGAGDLVLMFMEAAERAFETELGKKVRAGARALAQQPSPKRADAQLVFCIDVRSEPLRRAIEAQGAYETLGYAGFFGLPIALRSPLDGRARRQLPVLIEPCHELPAVEPEDLDQPVRGLVHRAREGLGLRRVAAAAKEGVATGFALAETAGPFAGLMLAARSVAPKVAQAIVPPCADTVHAALPACRLGHDHDHDHDHDHHRAPAIPLASKVDYAISMFKLTGLDPARLAPLVVLMGHGASTVNNPYAGSLDCGACGGRAGGPNARVLAQILNEPAVRAVLAGQGMAIPVDTHVLAGQHDTTTDEVCLYDLDNVPAGLTGALDDLRRDLARASESNRAVRAGRLGRDSRDVITGSVHWGEVRPEWGLSGNAAFIVADRAVSRSLDLEGRAFLHSYNWEKDEDGSALTTILTAPMVVAQWINCQYLFSTLDNHAFGAGDKTTHNVIGGFGVVQGNGGDLCVGLPRQSLFLDDGTPYHMPQRLVVVVHAPLERVDKLVCEVPVLTRLFGNGWVRLVVIDPRDGAARRWTAGDGATFADVAPRGWSQGHYLI